MQVQPPLRFAVYDFLKTEKNATDAEVLEMLNKLGPCSMSELNKVLLQLEILGLVEIRWIGKDKRRIELREQPQQADATRERQASS